MFPQVQSLAGSLFDKYNAFQEVQKTIVKATRIKISEKCLGNSSIRITLAIVKLPKK